MSVTVVLELQVDAHVQDAGDLGVQDVARSRYFGIP